MKAESIESLMIDRALGELSPAAQELLAEHLARAPEEDRQAQALDAIVRQARTAAAPPATELARPWRATQMRALVRDRRWRAWMGEGARLAACLALGLALGWTGRAGRDGPVVAVVPAVPAPPVAVGAPKAAAPGSDFWSLQNLAAARSRRQVPAAAPLDRRRLRWDSPVKMPMVEDNL